MFRFCAGACTKTLVVFDLPLLSLLFHECFVICNREELLACSAVGCFDDWGHEFFEEVCFQEGRPKVVQKIDKQTFDMGTIMILVRHEHYVAVSKRFDVLTVVVLLVWVQTHDLD